MRMGWHSVVLAVPVLAVLLAVSASIWPGSAGEIPCRIAPNGRVLSFYSACPLRTNDLVLSVYASGPAEGVSYSAEALSSRLGEEYSSVLLGLKEGTGERIVEVSIFHPQSRGMLWRFIIAALLASVTLLLPISIARNTSDPSATPLLVLNSLTATITVSVVYGQGSLWLDRMSIAAAALLPAATAHLGFTFPKVRSRVLSSASALQITYGIGFIFVVGVVVAFERHGGYWPFLLWSIGALQAAAWALFVSTCWFASRESSSPTEKARAELLQWGALVMPAMSTLFLLRTEPQGVDALTTFSFCAAPSMTIPVAVAVSRYNLFSLREDLRRLIARLFFVLSSGMIMGGLWAIAIRYFVPGAPESHFVTFIVIGAFGMLVLELLRGPMLRIIKGYVAPTGWKLSRIQASFLDRLVEARGSVDVGAALCDSISASVSAGKGWVYLDEAECLVPVAVLGDHESDVAPDPTDALSVLGDQAAVQLAAGLESTSAAAERLSTAGVMLVVRLDYAGNLVGLIMLSAPSSAAGYSRQQIDFIRTIATQAAMAIHAAKLAEDLAASSVEVSRAAFATGLLHDVGKEVSWLRMISGRLTAESASGPRSQQDLESLRRLSRDLGLRIREFMSTHAADGVWEVPAGRVIERSIESAARLSPATVIESTMPAEARRALVDARLVHVITNLIDNAARASEPGASIRVFVTLEERWLAISVVDRGVGLGQVGENDPFRLGFTTRANEGGSGIGLAYAKDIVQSLGGAIELIENETLGARAIIKLPIESLGWLDE